MVKKKDFSPGDFVISHGKIQIGTVGMVGLAGRMPDSSSKSGVVRGMETVRVVPTVHAVGGTFGSLKSLEDVVKKKRRK